MRRRTVLLGTGALAVGAAAMLRPRDSGGPYSDYFAALNRELKAQGVARPCLLLDLDRLDANIDQVRASVRAPKTYRVVAKSLPSLKLLEYVMQRAATSALMSFHQPFLSAISAALPDADVLLGKPMPVDAVRRFYQRLGGSRFDPASQLQWLVDTPQRLGEYHALAQTLGTRLRISLEIDVGLHRGGFAEPAALAPALATIAADPQHLELAGFMGYEPHIAKLPGMQSNLAKAKQRYRDFVETARSSHGALFGERTCLNTAGSGTYRLYEDDGFCNDLSVGSALVKPTDFDLATLETHVPAAFIATPVLKHYDRVVIPGLEPASRLFAAWNPNRQQAWYIYGGNWLARYENPPGLLQNALWGHSSNQEMVTGSARVNLEVDDYVFLRPAQSEFVLLQFGDLVAVRNGRIVDYWPVLQQGS